MASRQAILSEFDFRRPQGGWRWPLPPTDVRITSEGCRVSPAPGAEVCILGDGVHTRSGDSIELHFGLLGPSKGRLKLVYVGGFEHVRVTLDAATRQASVSTSEWNRKQPVARARLSKLGLGRHVLQVVKREGAGRLVKTADLEVRLDNQPLLHVAGLSALPEMGVAVCVEGLPVLLRRFVHRGVPSGIPEYLHAAGWQMLNQPSIEANLESLARGLHAAAEQGVQLLVTPETSLTGLFELHPVTRRRKPIEAAEQALRRMLRQTRHAPHLVVGLPVWAKDNGRLVRYNGVRVYQPDGHVLLDGRKIHSCEQDFWHGYRLHEFDVCGVPASIHICHDTRYPEVWTLPIMFGARLILHLANSSPVDGSIDAFEAGLRQVTSTMHAFYLRASGGGGTCLLSPQKYGNILAVSDECRRDQPSFPLVGRPQECLVGARIRVHDAFGYWPMRSFRTSEAVAAAYVQLYQSLGGRRSPAR